MGSESQDLSLGSNGIRKAVKAIVPTPLLESYRKFRLERSRSRNAGKSRTAIFTEIYENNEWGGSRGEYCSGSGSAGEVATAYGVLVRELIRTLNVRSIVDLGCGDFSVASRFVTPEIEYVGVDIVEGLVFRNQELFGSDRVRFVCLDAVVDDLPAGDICLVRQVLQHLSNSEIGLLLKKLQKYRFVVVTEHHPADGHLVAPNIDKPHGGDTRILDGSGVYLDRPPFEVLQIRQILETPATSVLVNPGETIRTFLISNQGSSVC